MKDATHIAVTAADAADRAITAIGYALPQLALAARHDNAASVRLARIWIADALAALDVVDAPAPTPTEGAPV
jgi:hypothetical protein